MVNDIILEIDSISKSFIKSNKNIADVSNSKILEDFDFILEKGKITALIGGNGAGKTTLFNIISRLVNPDNGSVILYKSANPIPLLKYPAYKLAELGIGRMFQSSHIFEQMTVFENMLIGFQYLTAELPFAPLFLYKTTQKTDKQAKDKAKYIISSILGEGHIFWKQQDQLANRLSYGQKRILELMRLIMHEYDLLLLDEPTAGINPVFCKEIGNILETLVHKMGVSVFLIEHNMRFVKDHADVCHFMYHGRDHIFGTPDDILGNDDVRRMYLGA
jgi:branched-chain amino acid transport system ATP-binding protein